MSRIAVQIYEIQDPHEAEAIIEVGVDHIGSVVVSEEKWKVPAIREVVLVSRDAHVKHSLIPLFNTREVLFRAIDYYQMDIIHFCESLTCNDGRMIPCESLVELQVSIRKRFPKIEVMRSVPIPTTKSNKRIPTLKIAECFQPSSSYFLTDTWLGKEPVDGYLGITGQACDWPTAIRLVEWSSIPVILAGGISPKNVYASIMAVKPFGVDSCTGTNARDRYGRPVRFKKDYEKVKAFVTEVRRAEEDLFQPRTEPK